MYIHVNISVCNSPSQIWIRLGYHFDYVQPSFCLGVRSLVGCSPWGRWESDTTERLHFHFSLLCIGEGNGNPLQCSCLENPRDVGAWWAAIYGVTQSRTRLKQLSSSSLKYQLLSNTLVTPGGLQSMGSLRVRHD